MKNLPHYFTFADCRLWQNELNIIFMITVLEVLMIVGVFIVPILLTPKKKHKVVIDTNTCNAEYGVDPDGYLVKL